MQSAFPCNRAIVQYETSDLNPTIAAILHLNPPAPHQRRHSLTRLERISLPGASLLLLPGPHRGRRAASAPPHRGAAAAPPCRGGIQAWTRATMGGRELHGRAAASSSCRAPLLLCGRAGWGERRREEGPPPGGGRHGEQRNRPARARRERGEDARQGGRGEAPRGGRRPCALTRASRRRDSGGRGRPSSSADEGGSRGRPCSPHRRGRRERREQGPRPRPPQPPAPARHGSRGSAAAPSTPPRHHPSRRPCARAEGVGEGQRGPCSAPARCGEGGTGEEEQRGTRGGDALEAGGGVPALMGCGGG